MRTETVDVIAVQQSEALSARRDVFKANPAVVSSIQLNRLRFLLLRAVSMCLWPLLLCPPPDPCTTSAPVPGAWGATRSARAVLRAVVRAMQKFAVFAISAAAVLLEEAANG